ncbi:prepilin-type N-terminal cleavage/methylation domain-containing protein [Ferroacidibacillus organovorans]|nr:prepilin-type N-terminal cleavage/methylation domain-containing protein [Ferroacidibacillus organovorans]
MAKRKITSHSASDKGFSLLEMTLTIAVISVALGFAMPDVLHTLQRANVWSTSAIVASDLRATQVRAEWSGRFQDLRFDPQGTQYYRYDSQIGAFDSAQFAPFVEFEQGYLHLQSPYIRYYSSGDVSESGTVYFQDAFGDLSGFTLYLGRGEIRER